MQEPTAPSRQQASGRRRVPGGGAGWGQTGKQRASQPVGRRAPACWGAWENKLDKSKSKMDRRSAHNTAGRHHPADTTRRRVQAARSRAHTRQKAKLQHQGFPGDPSTQY